MDSSTLAVNTVMAQARTTRAWNSRATAIAAVLLSIVPLLWPSIPPLTDLPGHMGSFYVAASKSSALAPYFGFQWTLIGNLGVDLLMVPFGHWFGIELGTKLLAIAIPAITVAGMLWLANEAHGRLPATAAFALPLAYCFPFNFGFVNYCLSAGLMLCGLALWLQLGRQGRAGWRAALFAVLAIVIWGAHAIGWVMLCVACGAAELQRQHAATPSWPRAIVRTFLAWLPLCTPVVLLATVAHQQHRTAVLYRFHLHEGIVWLASILRDRWMGFDLVSTAVLFGLLVLALIRWRGIRMAPVLAWPGAALFVLFVVAPGSINGSAFVNTRIAPYALALLLLAIDMRGLSPLAQRRFALAALAFLFIRTAGTTLSFALYDRQWNRELAALEYIPRGSTVVNFAPAPGGALTWYSPRLEHLSAMAIERRDAFVNSEWDIDGLQLLQVRYRAAGEYGNDPSQLFLPPNPAFPDIVTLDQRLREFPRAAFDYLWLTGVPNRQRPTASDLQLVWSNDDSALYRIQHP